MREVTAEMQSFDALLQKLKWKLVFDFFLTKNLFRLNMSHIHLVSPEKCSNNVLFSSLY